MDGVCMCMSVHTPMSVCGGQMSGVYCYPLDLLTFFFETGTFAGHGLLDYTDRLMDVTATPHMAFYGGWDQTQFLAFVQ